MYLLQVWCGGDFLILEIFVTQFFLSDQVR